MSTERQPVSESAVRIVNDLDEVNGVVTVAYEVADIWVATLKMFLDKASDPRNFTSLEFTLNPKAKGPNRDAEPDITNRLLRLIPFRDAHQCADRHMLKFWTTAAPAPPDELGDVASYAQLARSYEYFADQFPEQPLKQMADRFDLNRSTLAARVNRAKDLGLLARPSKGAPFTLTGKAKALLDGEE